MMRKFGRRVILAFLLAFPAIAAAQSTADSEIAAGRAAMAAKDRPGAIAHLSAACDLGSIDMCEAVASGLVKGSDADKARAAALFGKACAAGRLPSCHNVASLYNSGSGVPIDQPRAQTLFEKNCAAGLMASCTAAAANLIQGKGIPMNKPKAAALLQKSCDGGTAIACTAAGNLYRGGGDGIARDEPHAIALYGRGCDLKDLNGCDLAGLLIEGQGLEADRNNLIGDIKSNAKAVCTSLSSLGCAGGKPLTAADRPPPRTERQIASAQALALGYFRKALAIDPADKTALKEVADLERPAGAARPTGEQAARPPAPAVVAQAAAKSAPRSSPPLVPAAGGPGFLINVDENWTHHRDEKGNYRLIVADHSSSIMVSVIPLAGSEGDVDDLFAREILKAAGASAYSRKGQDTVYWTGSPQYESTIAVGGSTWPLTLTLVHIDKTHVGAVTVIHRPDMTEQQDLALAVGKAGVLVNK